MKIMLTDPVKKRPSITLTTVFFSFWVALSAVIKLCYDDIKFGVPYAIMFFFGCMIFYRLRKLDNFKIDLDDRSVSVNEETHEKSKPKDDCGPDSN